MRVRLRRLPALMGITAAILVISLGIAACGPAASSSTPTPTAPSFGTPGVGAPGAGGTPYATVVPNSAAGPQGTGTPALPEITQQQLLATISQAASRMHDILANLAESGTIDASQMQYYLGQMSEVVYQIDREPAVWSNFPADLRSQAQDAMGQLSKALSTVQMHTMGMTEEQQKAALNSLADAMATLSTLAQQMGQSLPQPTAQQVSSMTQLAKQMQSQLQGILSNTGLSTATPAAGATP